MQTVISDQKIDYTFKRLLKTRSLRISIRRDGKITVTAPFFISMNQAEKFLFQNRDWILKKLKFHQARADKSIFPSNPKDFLMNKSRALHLVRDKLAKLNKVYDFHYNKVTIRNQNSRWGSCSKNGNINFNYKLIYLADELAEYVVAHELCHLQEMNHSARFWKLVARTVPNYLILRKQLKNIF